MEEVEWVSIMPKQCAAEEVEVNYNIGDLVRRHSGTKIGVVIKVREGYAQVLWMNTTGGVWSLMKALEIINENR